MSYADLKDRKQHAADAARIAQLEAELKRERERDAKGAKPSPQATPPKVQPQAQPVAQTVIVRNEGCLAGAGKGCLSIIGGIIVLAIVGKLLEFFFQR